MGTIADLILLLVLAAAVGVRLERWLQIFQQEHYEGARLQVWVGCTAGSSSICCLGP